MDLEQDKWKNGLENDSDSLILDVRTAEEFETSRIPNSVNIDFYNQKNISILKQEKMKKDWQLLPNKFTILLPGRLTYWKGQEKLIEALNILNEEIFTT